MVNVNSTLLYELKFPAPFFIKCSLSFWHFYFLAISALSVVKPAATFHTIHTFHNKKRAVKLAVLPGFVRETSNLHVYKNEP